MNLFESPLKKNGGLKKEISGTFGSNTKASNRTLFATSLSMPDQPTFEQAFLMSPRPNTASRAMLARTLSRPRTKSVSLEQRCFIARSSALSPFLSFRPTRTHNTNESHLLRVADQGKDGPLSHPGRKHHKLCPVRADPPTVSFSPPFFLKLNQELIATENKRSVTAKYQSDTIAISIPFDSDQRKASKSFSLSNSLS